MTNEQYLALTLKTLGYELNMTELKNVISQHEKKCGKLCLFSRVSTLMQDLDQQTNELYAEAERYGYSKDDIVLIEQKESAIKLEAEERIGIQKLKDIIEHDNIECVLIYEISRLSRRPDVLYNIRDYLIKKNIQLVCLKPYMRLLDNDGKMSQTAMILFSLFGTLAESEMMLKKERMQRGKRHKQALGGYIGGRPLFGYTFEHDKLCIDYREAEVVRRVYDLYEKGMSFRSIAIEMMQTGELKQDNLISANRQVQNILSRPEYSGGISTISNYRYPAIVTKTQYEKARKLAKDRTKEHSRVKHTCLCKRLIYAKDNNYSLTPDVAKKQYRLYTIDKSVNMTVRIDLMDNLVWDVVKEHAEKKFDDKETILRLERESAISLRKIQQAMRNIKDLNKQIDKIEERIIEGKMSEIKGDQMIMKKRQEIIEMQDMLDNQNYIYGQKQAMLHEGTYKQSLDNITLPQERQDIVRKYVKKIMLEKTRVKRGHYWIDIVMQDDTIYKYTLWSSGPWNNVERVE